MAALLVVIIFAATWLAVSALPALIVMWGWNYVGPQFGSHVHLNFWAAWLVIFAIGVVVRVIRGGKD